MTCLKLQVSRDKGVGESSWPARHPWHRWTCQEVVRERERGRELQLMIEPHWFLFVHKKVFILQITEIIGCCHNIYLLSGFCIGFIHISLVMMWGRNMGWVLGMLPGCLSPSTSIIDYRPQRIKDDSYRTCDRKISL